MLISIVSLFISTSQWVIPYNIETNNVIKLPFYTRSVICSYEIGIKFLFRKRITKINKILLFHAAIRWKEHNKLNWYFYTECETGYYGYLLQCKMCPYPSYGTECQSMCDCQNESCNHITGCQGQISNEGTFIL